MLRGEAHFWLEVFPVIIALVIMISIIGINYSRVKDMNNSLMHTDQCCFSETYKNSK